MEPLERVLAICVNWNGGQVLEDCIRALQKSDFPLLDLLVVDNASADDSMERLPDSVARIRLEENRGYASALNAAVRQVIAPAFTPSSASVPTYIFIINNDVIVRPNTLSLLVDLARRHGPGIYGPRVLRHGDPRRLDSAWGRVSWSHVLAKFYGKGANDAPRWRESRPVPLLLGCALLIHRRIFEEIGLFDEEFFMYHEEVDFLYRASLQGLPVYYCGVAETLHHGAYSTRRQPDRKFRWVRQNAVYFLRKHQAGLLQWSYYGLTLLASLIFHLISFRWRRIGLTLRAVRAGMKQGGPQLNR